MHERKSETWAWCVPPSRASRQWRIIVFNSGLMLADVWGITID
ncbi:MAG: hypothetical protein WCL08_10945 [Verrucomicrobiota bacterium]